jgi:UDPglucose 6-dehydrogenase
MSTPRTVAVIGLWHLGEMYSAGFAELGHAVVGIADDARLIENFKKSTPPLPEPRLEEFLTKHQKAGKLTYTTDISAVKNCDTVWLAFDTPVDDHDEVDLAPVWDAVRKMTPHLAPGTLVGASSQLPVGTSAEIVRHIAKTRPDLKFFYAYSPENLRLGDAVKCFLEPGRVVIGADTREARERAAALFAPTKADIVPMSVASAEMAKHAMNAWLATSISFTNDLADVCERVGADIEDVVKALKAEPRVGPKAYLFAGLGFSGGTLGRDLKALLAAAKRENLELPIVAGAYAKNQARNAVVPARLRKKLGELRGKTLAVFGVTYKPGTPTLRRSQPLEIESALRAAGASLRLADPLAVPAEVAAVTPSPFFRDPYEAAQGADAVLVLSPDRKLQELDFKKLASVMKTPVLFDAQNVLVAKEPDIRSAGFAYLSIGRP